MKRILPVIALLSVAFGAHAQNLILKDGRVVAGSKLRRDGATIITTVTIGNGPGEIGYAVAQIASIEFPDPPQLREAATLIAANKLDQALGVIEPVLNFYNTYKDIKGSFWGDAASLKLTIYTALRRDRDAESLIREILASKVNADSIAIATATKALIIARAGRSREAIEASSAIIDQDNGDSASLALAYAAKGESHLALKEYEDGVFAFLHVPIFFPEQKLVMPMALLGSAHCFSKLDGKKELEEAITTLLVSYPGSVEANTARSEFPNIASRIQKTNNP